MPDTAVRPIGPVLLGTVTATLYTVPAATKLIVRSIHVANETANSVAFTLALGADAVGKRLYSAMPLPANGALDWSGFMVVLTGELITGFAAVANAVTITVSGVTET